MRSTNLPGAGTARLGSLLCCLLLAACSSAPPPPVILDGRIEYGQGVNPDSTGRASPLFLRVYQLKAPESLLAASSYDLSRNDALAIGGDLVKREMFEFCPPGTTDGGEPASRCHSENVELRVELDPEARFLGVVADFYDIRDPNGRWRQVRPIPPPESRFLRSDRLPVVVIKLEKTTVSVEFE